MSIGPGAAKIGVPYLVEYEGEQWTGIRSRYVRPLSMGMLPPHLWQKEKETTTWLFLRYENDTGLISQQVVYAEDQDFGEIVPLVPSRKIDRDDLPTAEEAREIYGRAPWGFNAFSRILDAVVDHLNGRGGIPSERGNACCEEAALTANEAKAAHDNWMAASKRADRAEGKLYKARKDAEWYRNLALKGDQYAEELITERDELREKLDALQRPSRAKEQRIEEHAKLLAQHIHNDSHAWDNLTEPERVPFRSAVRPLIEDGDE